MRDTSDATSWAGEQYRQASYLIAFMVAEDLDVHTDRRTDKRTRSGNLVRPFININTVTLIYNLS